MQVVIDKAEFDEFYDAGRRDFKRATLQNVDFFGRNISGLDLTDAILTGCNLRNVTIGEKQFFLLKPNGVLRGVPCKIVGEVSSIALYEADLTHADVSEMTLLPGARFKETRLTAAQAIRFSEQGALVEALKGYNCFFGTTMSLAEFDTLIRQGFKIFTGVTVDGIKDEKIPTLTLDEILIVNATIMNVDLREAKIFATTTFSGTTFSNVKVGKEQLKAILKKTVNLGGLNLSDLDLSWMDLQRANLRNTTVRGAKFGGAILKDAVLGRDQLIEVLKTNKNLSKIILPPDTDLDGVDISDADLSGATLNGLDLTEVTLHRAKLYATSREYTIMGAEQLRCFMESNCTAFEKIQFRGDFSDLSLERMKFEACSFASASGVRLRGATVLGCNLDMNLDGTDVSEHPMDGMYLASRERVVQLNLTRDGKTGRWRILSPTSLLECALSGVNLRHIDWSHVLVRPGQLCNMLLEDSHVPELLRGDVIRFPNNIFTLLESVRHNPSSHLSSEIYRLFGGRDTILAVSYLNPVQRKPTFADLCYQTGLAQGCDMRDLLYVLRECNGNFFNPYNVGGVPDLANLNYHSEPLPLLATNECRQDTRETYILAAAMRQMLFAALTSPRLEQESVIIDDAATLNIVFSLVSREDWPKLNPALKERLEKTEQFKVSIQRHCGGAGGQPLSAVKNAEQHAALRGYLGACLYGNGDLELQKEALRTAYDNPLTGNRIAMEITKLVESFFQQQDDGAIALSIPLGWEKDPLRREQREALQQFFDPDEIDAICSELQNILLKFFPPAHGNEK